MECKLNFYTQYHQFYITSDGGSALDQKHKKDPDYFINRVMQVKNFLKVKTESYGQIKGQVTILDSVNNDIDLTKYDHIVEAGIDVESGVLQFMDCPNSAIELEVKVNPGSYRVRVCISNLQQYDEENENDYYTIEIWPDKNLEVRLLKKFVR